MALAIHAALLGTVGVVGLRVGTSRGATPAPAAPASPAEVALSQHCQGDAALAFVARATACAAPWVPALEACVAVADAAWQAEAAECTMATSLVDVTLLPAPTAAQLAAIDPEPLLDILTAADQLKHEQQQQAQQQQQQQQAERQREQLARAAQVVETAKPATEIDPEQARFVSDHSVKVERETVARGSRHEEMVARSQAEQLKPKDQPRPASVAESPSDQLPGKNPEAADNPGPLSMRAPGAVATRAPAQEARVAGVAGGSTAAPGDGATARRGDGRIAQDRRDPTETSGQGGGGGGNPRPNLTVSDEVLERALGGGSVDHLDGVADGDETALNAKRWVYASFFNRMKRQVAQNWEPAQVWRRHDPTGSVYGFKSRITHVRVTLDRSGALSKIVVTRPSGVAVLDDEATRAFQAAQPFPNPPAGLVATDNQISFDFSFHFEIGAPRTSWKIIRN